MSFPRQRQEGGKSDTEDDEDDGFESSSALEEEEEEEGKNYMGISCISIYVSVSFLMFDF